jgi:hypothetical protein
MAVIQAPWIILPRLAPTGVEVETVNDLAEHTSREFPVEYLQEKEIHILATEVIDAGVPGNLNCWVELSPFPSVNSLVWLAPLPVSATYWAAIGGGGGAMAPIAPLVEPPVPLTGTVHSILIPWAIHSGWARLVVQTPVAATPATAFWIVQAIFSAASK